MEKLFPYLSISGRTGPHNQFTSSDNAAGRLDGGGHGVVLQLLHFAPTNGNACKSTLYVAEIFRNRQLTNIDPLLCLWLQMLLDDLVCLPQLTPPRPH